MPIYEYRCDRCDRKFEVLQKFSDKPLTTHQGCGGAVERLISTSALQFKGTGWYITDYAHKHSSPSEKSESNGNGSSSSNGGSAKSESKTATASSTSSSKSEPKPVSK
jgi:putative FmdB family regulatory protein